VCLKVLIERRTTKHPEGERERGRYFGTTNRGETELDRFGQRLARSWEGASSRGGGKPGRGKEKLTTEGEVAKKETVG